MAAEKMYSTLFNRKGHQKRGLALKFFNAFSKSIDIDENSVFLNMYPQTHDVNFNSTLFPR